MAIENLFRFNSVKAVIQKKKEGATHSFLARIQTAAPVSLKRKISRKAPGGQKILALQVLFFEPSEENS